MIVIIIKVLVVEMRIDVYWTATMVNNWTRHVTNGETTSTSIRVKIKSTISTTPVKISIQSTCIHKIIINMHGIPVRGERGLVVVKGKTCRPVELKPPIGGRVGPWPWLISMKTGPVRGGGGVEQWLGYTAIGNLRDLQMIGVGRKYCLWWPRLLVRVATDGWDRDGSG